jgi:hypothetical protein
MRSVEFRVPMSPTRSFYHQARLFDFALRKLGGGYRDAKVAMIVGDNEPIERVRAQNSWSIGRNVEWIAVPPEVFNRYGIHGTADYRYFPDSNADFVALSDADTILVRDIDPLLESIDPDEPVVAGHMAHWAPEMTKAGSLGEINEAQLWGSLLQAFGLEPPAELHRYSMDRDQRFAPIPAYFNLGFILMTRSALAEFRQRVFAVQDKLLELYPTNMRCQFAVTLMALQSGVRLLALPAEYNLANDLGHLTCNRLSVEDARVIHYLRSEELKRESLALPEGVQAAVGFQSANPINRRLQQLLLQYATEELSLEWGR